MELTDAEIAACMPPVNTNTFCIPQEHQLLQLYDVYKTSTDTRTLRSEIGRSVFSSAYIEDLKLGTLADLCVRTLAKAYGPSARMQLFMDDPLKARIFYDSLDIELPLKELYFITDQLFWQRLVRQKSRGNQLVFFKSLEECDWHSAGLGVKLAEVLESLPAEYWPEKEMKPLLQNISKYVKELNIKHLQSLDESSFKQYYESSTTETPDSESWVSEDTWSDEEKAKQEIQRLAEMRVSLEKEQAELEAEAQEEEDPEAEEFGANAKAERWLQFQNKMEEYNRLKRKRNEKTERRRQRVIRRERVAKKPRPVNLTAETEMEGDEIFDLDLPRDSEEGLEDKIHDRRNPQLYLERMRNYKYPPEHCHHLDLSHLKALNNLETFSIEFHGPPMERDYHTKHLNCSYDDMRNLAVMIINLPKLKTFRLTNSRLDGRKMDILLNALKNCEMLEHLDFSKNELKDDFGDAIYEFFAYNKSLKKLELGHNNSISTFVLGRLGDGLLEFKGQLEYLGLAHSKLLMEGLDRLAKGMLQNQQVRQLNISGACGSQEALRQVLAKQIVRYHTPLVELDMTGVICEEYTAVALINAFKYNMDIMEFKCQGCQMPPEILSEMIIICARNHYVKENTFIGNENLTPEEVKAFAHRIKHPVLLNSINNMETKLIALQNRADIKCLQPEATPATFFPSIEDIEGGLIERPSACELLTKRVNKLREFDNLYQRIDSEKPFEFKTSDLQTPGQIYDRIYMLGPRNRFNYFLDYYATNCKKTVLSIIRDN